MQPIKRDGTNREQINLEDKIRREYPKKWGALTQPSVNDFYNPNFLCQEFRTRYKEDHNELQKVFAQTKAEERFLSKEMFKELLGKCRCGRSRNEATHLDKCLQKAKPERFHKDFEPREDSPDSMDSDCPSFPVTSSAVIGWAKHRYLALERSTYYISPKNSIPGGRIDDKPYSNIFIG